MNARRPVRPGALRILVATLVLLCRCSDKTLTTQPLTPTPIPTKAPLTISMEMTLSRSDPPAGVKHAARAAVVVRETGGRAVHLTNLLAGPSDYFDETQIHVSGFTPTELSPNQTASFTVTLTTGKDMPCSTGLLLEVYTAEEGPAFASAGCETVDWPF
jgi:hypothetical protein